MDEVLINPGDNLLIIIDPKEKNSKSVIYVELAEYKSRRDMKYTFKVGYSLEQEQEVFNRFISEFEDLWIVARSWTTDAAN